MNGGVADDALLSDLFLARLKLRLDEAENLTGRLEQFPDCLLYTSPLRWNAYSIALYCAFVR